MKKLVLTLLASSFVALLVYAQGPPTPDAGAAVGAGAAVTVEGRPAAKSFELLDRGIARQPQTPEKGGTPPPTGPTTIAYPGGGPGAIAAGAPMAGAFPGMFMGGFFGNLFAPGVGFPSSFLTAGATSGFVVTGAYAWHSPATAGGGPGGSSLRVLAAAAAAVPGTPFSAVPTGGFSIFTVSTGAPGPAGVVGGPGIFPGVRIGGTAMAGPTATPVPASAAFCGLIAGGPMFFSPGWMGNGLGGSLPPMGPGVPLRVGFFPPFFFPGSPISAMPAPPQDFIAGCFADSSTTPVELMAFEID